MLKWLIKNSRFIFNQKGQFDPLGFQQEIGRQVGGLRQLGLSELQRRQQLQNFMAQELIKQQIAQQDPMQQLLQRGQAAQAISNISELGGDVSQFQGLFGGGAGVTAQPITQPTPGLRPTPTITGAPAIEPVTPEARPTKFERTPFGQLRPTAFERVATQEELDKEAEQDAKAAGIKEQVLNKLKGLPGESAAKLTMIHQALSDLDDVEKLLFTPEGKLIKGLATAANIPAGRFPLIPSVVPFASERVRTLSRQINSKMNNALEAKLRIETGAAATQDEFTRLQTRFGISYFDSTASAKDKLKRLKEFMKNAIITIDPTGRFIYKTGDARLDKELSLPSPQSLGLDPNRFEVIGD